MMLSLLLAALAAPPVVLRDAVATHNCPEVVRALTPEDDADRLALGWCLMASDPPRAIAVLATLDTPEAAPYGRWFTARAQLNAGDAAHARTSLEGIVLPGEAGLQVRLLRGRALVATGRSLEARPELRALLPTSAGVPARYWLAVGGEDRGANDAAIATYEAVWAADPTGRWSDPASEALSRLGQPVPNAASMHGRSLITQRARTLSSDHQPAAAADLLGMLEDATTPDVDGLALAHARANARDNPGALTAFAAVLGPPEAAAGTARDLFDYGLTTARTGDYTTAGVIYERLMALHPEHDLADFASFKRGYMAYDARDCAAARPLFAAHMAQHPTSKHLDEALWFAGRCAWLQADFGEVDRLLTALAARRPRSSLVPGAAYWRARAAGALGDADAERAGLEEVLRRWPVSGYAWFAAERLGRHFVPPTTVATPPEWPSSLAAEPAVKAAELLLQAGLPALARDQLTTLAGRAHGKTATLALAHAWLRAGDYRQARALASPWCGRPWETPDAAALAMCLPRPEQSIVQAVADRGDLDADLPYAIMTAESALNPAISSAAGARGLMQVMPQEGARMHLFALGDDVPYTPGWLTEGPYNAALGTAELVLKAHALAGVLTGSDLPAVIASYNGGESAVRRWLSASDSPPDPDAWTEEIGYSETRKYVRRVLGFRMAYRWAYGDPTVVTEAPR